MKKIILLSLLMLLIVPRYLFAQNDAMMQAFYWNVPVDETAKNGTWWDNLSSKATELKNAGITGIWIPVPAKGNWGITDMGYGIYDHYDLGNYNQKGSVETRFGSRQELENMIAAMHNISGGKPKINVYADVVLNHVYSGDENDEVNPAVKGYVFDEAYRNGTQYVPYPTNEIKWVIPNAGAGDYYIKIKGYSLNWGASQDERAYDVQIDWTGSGFGSSYSWESEPNGGNGQSDVFPASGETVRGFMSSSSDIDEYKVTLGSSHDIVIKLTARKNVGGWNWADQVNGYYPFEIWHNGQNLASSALEAHTNTHITYINHTGSGEANYEWHYNDFHPVDQYDFLTGWDSNGGNSALIPNTKGFGNDFNTYSSNVQNRLNDWGYWLADEIGFDGFRLDFVRGFQIDFTASWINNLPLLNGSQRFIVGEYWGPDSRIKEWVNGLAAQGADADGFDFPLKSSLTDMCNGDAGFDMRWLNHAGMVRNDNGNALSGTSVVTWLENHDTGKEHDKWVTKDWKMGYAYILTHEGRPCIFYPHYYGVTLVDNNDPGITVSIPSSLKDDINKLLFVRKTYLGGTLTVLSDVGNPYPSGDAQDVYVARRQGNGTKGGAIVVINNSYSTKGLWVDSSPSGFANWSNSTLTNAFTGATTNVYADGRVWVEAPARGYAVYVASGDYVPYTAPSSRMEGFFDERGENTSETSNDSSFHVYNLYPNPVTGSKINLDFQIPTDDSINVEIIDLTGVVMKKFTSVRNAGRNNLELDVSGLSAGVYFYRLKYKDQINTFSILIN